jgi:hypothetical protein
VARDLVIKIFFLLLSVYCAQTFAAEAPASLYEQKIKAGLVYNLIKYTEWSTATLTPPNQIKNNYNPPTLKICIFGEDPFDGYLSPLQGRTAQQSVISIAHVTNVPETGICNAIIIHHNQRENLQNLFLFLQGKNILTISDIKNFAELGGMIELARQEEKISLVINKDALDAAKLVIDSRMLKLATLVSREGAK